MKGAYAVFSVTNFQELMSKERELQQGKNVADIAKVQLIPQNQPIRSTNGSRNSMFSTWSGAAHPMSPGVLSPPYHRPF
jgi:hypothetical protein